MIATLNKIRDGIVDVIWPKKCLGCGREGSYICKDCEVFLGEVESVGSLSQTNIISVWEYEGLMEKLISKIKEDGCYHIIGELVARVFGKIELSLPPDTYITYVPMHKKKEKRRGFNQAAFIAREVGEMANREVLPLLAKTIDNHPQAGLNPQERLENVRNAFVFQGKGVCPADVLLVDDFQVSGATIGECSRVLREAGARNVWGFTLAKTA